MDIDVICTDASECKAAARQYVMNNYTKTEVLHVFTDVSSQYGSGAFSDETGEARVPSKVCVCHGGLACNVSDPDILMSGLSCQPVSSATCGRYSPGGVERHPQFGTHLALFRIIKSRTSLRAGAVEEVLGFSHRDKSGAESPLQKFVNNLLSLHRYDVRVLELDNVAFLKFKRKRLTRKSNLGRCCS